MSKSISEQLFPPLLTLKWLLTGLILVVLPHIARLPPWVSGFFAVLLLWRYGCTVTQQLRLPNSVVQLLLALSVVVGVALTYRTIFGLDAGVALLVALCGLKLMEVHEQRDALLLCFLGYFLIITHFLYSQSIPTAIYMSVVMLVTTATLISLSDSNNCLSLRQRLRLAGVLLLQALPIMLVLFLLFPRIAAPFWTLPSDARRGLSGLSDTMSPGNISEMSLSDEIVFRVKFTNDTPPVPNQLYWRGPVLWWTNGQEWKGMQPALPNEPVGLQTTGMAYDYTITLEPHNQRWLFALDLPTKAPFFSFLTHDYQVVANIPIQQRIRYNLRSYTVYRADTFTTTQRQMALRLPINRHPKAIALAAQWKQTLKKPEAIVNQALNYFNQEKFSYTFTPPLVLDDSVDQFLFETKQGFCEHYAAAFTILMRAAGIPTRIITGYLGGEMNTVGGYLVIRQRDAHAWNEVWLEGQGWVRVDPTGMVAPERIERSTALPVTSALGINWNSDSPIANTWRHIRNSWDAVNNGWNQWVLGYGAERQMQLFNYFGFKKIHWQGLIVGIVIITTILLIVTAAWLWLRPTGVVHDPLQRLYQRFCNKLARATQIRRHISEGPATFACRVSAMRPDLADPVQQITDLYVQVRYGNREHLLSQLQKAIKRFHP